MQTAMPSQPQQQKILTIAVALLFCVLCFSGLHPHDRATWLMETLPVWIALPLLVYTYRRFPLTNLLYGLIFLHALILIVGGTYTYAHVPIGFWVQNIFSLARNPYDKLGHFAQGLVPALLAKEILLRKHYVLSRKMASFLSVCVAMAISACYELIEWWAALSMGQGADGFLGAQGDQWDTQSDMFMALIGATVAVLLLAHWHDKQLANMNAPMANA